MKPFFSKRLSALSPYVPGEQPQDGKYIKLNTNESPFKPSPEVIKAVGEEANKLQLYSDPEVKIIRSAIADIIGVNEENVFVGNGSDEVLAFSYMAFCDDETGVCYPDISYGFYPVYASLCGINAKEIPLKDDYSVNPSDYFNSGRTVFIANPNAPTGIALSLPQVESIVKNNPENIVVIDEAYVDFGGETAVPLIDKYDNLVIVRTFSKSRNLAGGRIGFALACKERISELNTIKFSFNPYNLNRLSTVAGAAAMRDVKYFNECIEKIKDARKFLSESLEDIGFTVLPSSANFIFAKHPKISGKELYKTLKDRKILVRYFDKDRLREFIRITIGTKDDMKILVDEIKEIIKTEK